MSFLKSLPKKYVLLSCWLVCLLVINAIILVNRQKGFAYTPYQTVLKIYNTDSTFFIQHLTVKSGVATVTFSKRLPSANYALTIDSLAPVTIRSQQNLLSFQLKPEAHTYHLQSGLKNEKPIELVIDLFSQAETEAELLYSNLPGPTTEFTSMSVWKNGIKGFSKEELQKAKSLLNGLLGWKNLISDYEKVLSISKFCAGLCNQKEAPYNPETIQQFSPWDQLNKALACQTSLNCGNYTMLFQYLCTAADIPSRGVTLGGTDRLSGWQFGVHFFNEAYVKELNQWVMFDGLANMIMPHDSAGRYFAAVEIKKLATAGVLSPNIVAWFSEGDSLSVKSLTFYRSHLNYYFRSDALLTFLHPGENTLKSRWQILLDFYSFPDDMSVYSETKRNNYLLISIKIVSFYLLIITGIIWLISSFLLFKKARK